MRELLLLSMALLVIIAILAPQVCAKGMWGSRRKRREDDDSPAAAEVNSGGGAELLAKARAGGGRMATRAGAGIASNNAAEVSESMNRFIDLLETFIDGEDFDQYISPEAIERFTSMLPPEVMQSGADELLKLPELQNPTLLKQMIREGLVSFRAYIEQFAEIIAGGPEAITTFLQTIMPEVPPETSEIITAIFNGDMDRIMQYVDALPGVDETQKRLIKSMLAGDVSGFQEMVSSKLQDMVGDDNNIEETRKLFLENPEYATAAGITEEQLKDPDQFKEFMVQGLSKLEGAMNEAGDDATSDQEELLRRFMESQAA